MSEERRFILDAMHADAALRSVVARQEDELRYLRDGVAERGVKIKEWMEEVARLTAENERLKKTVAEDLDIIRDLRFNATAEGTVLCTCTSYPHHPDCGLDARLVKLRAALAEAWEIFEWMDRWAKTGGSNFLSARTLHIDMASKATSWLLKHTPTEPASK